MAPEATVRLGCQGTGKGTSRALAKVRMSGDRKRDMTYLGRGITGPGDKGPVVRGQERVIWHTLAEASQAPETKVWLSGGQERGHNVPWQRHHRPRRQRSGCQGTGRGTSRHRCGRHTLPSAGLHTKTRNLVFLHFKPLFFNVPVISAVLNLFKNPYGSYQS
jgi:hypothetical protein